MSNRWVGLALVAAACGSGAPADPIAARCKPHRARELACADAETRQALALVGDMCQKALNGKNPQVFGPRAVAHMEAELACAVQHPTDCAAYVACRDRARLGE